MATAASTGIRADRMQAARLLPALNVTKPRSRLYRVEAATRQSRDYPFFSLGKAG